MSDFVSFFRGSSPYINAHRGKTFVLALSGESIAHDNFTHIVHDISLLHHLGIKLVIVHGARPQIEERLNSCNIQTCFENNKRITDNNALACVKQAVGSTRVEIESQFSMALANSPMAGAKIKVMGGNVITAKPVGIRNGIDFHHTGEVRRIDKDAITQLMDNQSIVLISPLGYSTTGETFNLSYDEVATQVAIALGAEKLMLFSSHTGICDEQGNLQKMVALNEVPNLIRSSHISGSDLTDFEAAYHACLNGVERAHIISYLDDGALIKELFTRDGTGTLVIKNALEKLRTATIDDVGGLLDLIRPLEESGSLVRRSRELLETEITRFTVVEHPEHMLIGCAALYPMSDGQAAEIACVAVHGDFQSQGLASRLLSQLEQQAKKQGIKELFVLSTQTTHWFKEQGFKDAALTDLPVEKQSCYNYQRNSSILKKVLA